VHFETSSTTHSYFRGLIREGDVMMLGPSEHGQFYKSKVMSIRRNRVPCRHIKAGQSATLALTGVEKAYIRRVSMFDF
jgi:GTPase